MCVIERWAHELTHVMQYDNMGVESFATIYSVNWDSLESQARDWASKVANNVQNSPQPSNQQFVRYLQQPQPNGYLSATQYQAAARDFYPPASCTETFETPQALFIHNMCPVPVLVVGWQQQNPLNGMIVAIPCVNNCWIGPSQNLPFQSPAPGPIVDVAYRPWGS